MTASDDVDLWLPTAVTDDEYIGPYRLIRKAGSGGMGVVYLAVDKTERPVAVKVLRDHIADDSDARARLRRELTTMRRVRDRYIADVVDADLEAERPYIVSEFVHGPQLDDYVDEVGPLGRDGLVTLGRGLISALHAIHSVGVVHRDLKPGNVLLEGHRPVVIDFGIAQLSDETRLTVTGLFIGTPGYVSPETIYGADATPATDWWSWAAVMAYAATVSSPAGKGPIEVVLDRISRGELRLDTVDADLRPLLRDCLAVQAADRPGYAEIRRRFDRYAAGASTGPSRLAAHRAAAQIAPDARGTEVLIGPPDLAPQGPHRTAVPQPDTLPGPSAAGGQPPAVRREQTPTEPRPTPKAVAREAAPPSRRAAGLPVFAFGALLVAISMTMPIAAALLTALSLAFSHTTERFVAGKRWRQELGASPRRAAVLQAFGTPWSALKSTVVAVGSLLLPLVVAAGTMYLAQRLLPSYGPAASYADNVAVGLGASVGALLVWYGPGGTSTRGAVHRTLRAVAPTKQSVLGLSGVLLVAATAILLVVYRYPMLDWWPLSGSLG